MTRAVAAVLAGVLTVLSLSTADAARRKKPRVRVRADVARLSSHGLFGLPRRVAVTGPAVVGVAPPGTTPPPATSTTTPTATTPAPPPPLPSRSGVELREYAVHLATDPLAAGALELDVENIGMDDHDFAIARDGVVVAHTGVIAPKGAAVVNVHLDPGDYKLYCTLYDGAHDEAGMHTTLRVRWPAPPA